MLRGHYGTYSDAIRGICLIVSVLQTVPVNYSAHERLVADITHLHAAKADTFTPKGLDSCVETLGSMQHPEHGAGKISCPITTGQSRLICSIRKVCLVNCAFNSINVKRFDSAVFYRTEQCIGMPVPSLFPRNFLGDLKARNLRRCSTLTGLQAVEILAPQGTPHLNNAQPFA